MATTKWLDPSGGWTLADWEDTDLTVLVSHLWPTLKGKADEFQAYFEQVHSASFDADNEFPDFNTLKSLFSGGTTAPDNAVKIFNAVYPYSERLGTGPIGPIDHDSIAADGTAVTNSVRPDDLLLTELLTGPLGYASGILLHMIDTNNGNDTAPNRMTWVVQWYQVMNYPQYYSFALGKISGITDFFEELQQVLFYRVEVKYGFETDELSPADVASAELTEPLFSPPVDIYTAGDLDDTTAGVYSTNQEIFDYAVAEFVEHYDGATWSDVTSPSTLVSADVKTICFMESSTLGSGRVDQTVTLTQNSRIRFKIKDALRALSPETFSQLVYHYFYMTETASGQPVGTHFYSAFGEGLNEDETKLKQFTLDADGYYYFSIQDPDFSGFTVPTRPSTSGVNNQREESNQIFTLTDGKALGTNNHNIYTKPNIDDDTEFNYYTPAP